MKKITFYILIASLILFASGCDRIKSENQITGLKTEIAQLKTKNEELINENKELTAQVARLNASEPGGAAIEELRKALTKKESELEHREKRIITREEALRLGEIKIDTLEREFYEKTGLKLEEIGEAKQIKREYEYMRENLEDAEAKANNWLIYFSGMLIGLFVCIVVLIFASMKYSSKNKQIETAWKIVESVDLSSNDKALIASSLGQLRENKLG